MSSSKHKQQRREEREEALSRMDAAERRKQRNVVLAGVATFLLVGGVAAAIVASSGSDGGSTSAVAAAKVDTAGLGPKFVANAKDANRVVDGQITNKLAELKGVPVVVNQWASWCPNCKAEFGYFAHLAKIYRGKVAFVGLDSQDQRGKAEAFLKDHAVPYPNIFDDSAAQAQSIGGGQGWPTTFFYDAKGKQTYIRPGGYTTEQSLDNDIRQYALGSSS